MVLDKYNNALTTEKHDDLVSFLFVKNKYIYKKHKKCDMIMLNTINVFNFTEWFGQVMEDTSGNIINNYCLQCDCLNEIIMINVDKDNDTVTLQYFDNYYLKKWGYKKYTDYLEYTLHDFSDLICELRSYCGKEISEKVSC